MTVAIAFDNSYARLPARFHARVAPARASAPRLIRVNAPLAAELGLDPEWLASPDGVAMLSGQRLPPGAEPIATAYAGHQFGGFSPQLGDGRALLLGEVVDRAGQRRDIQLKGSGPTPFSRNGDGLAALGPVLREYVVSEAMHALGIPTTRSLAAVTTGETVVRETVLPGAVLTRVASSHIRVGTFQYFAARGDVEGVRLLADHVVARHYPDAAGAERPYLALLDGVVARQAELIASWLCVGFVHGVMNTDNMSVAGETIDYGPCAFLDAYDPATNFSSIDQNGRYAYGAQPGIALWNLTRLAETLLPLLHDDEAAAVAEAEAALGRFKELFETAYFGRLRAKLGLATARDGDVALANDLLAATASEGADFNLTFRRLADAAEPGGEAEARRLFTDPAAFDAWLPRWRARLGEEGTGPAAARTAMRSVNPAHIPRNHGVEALIEAATVRGDFGPFDDMNAAMSQPFEDRPDFARYAVPPLPHERVRATFCGT